MKVHEFKSMVQYIRNSYGKPMLSDEMQDFLSAQIKHIPSEAVVWIREQFIRRYPKYPEVIHPAILDMYRAWRNEHPEKCATQEPGKHEGCVNDNCHGGWMVFWKREKIYRDQLTSFVVPCGDCRKSGNTSMRAWTLKQALEVNQDWEPDCYEIRKQHLEEIEDEVSATLLSYQAESRRKIMAGYKGVASADRT